MRSSGRVPLDPRVLVPALVGATLFSLAGARGSSPGCPAMPCGPWRRFCWSSWPGHTFLRRDFGRSHAPRLPVHRAPWAGFAAGAALGFYDGLSGPGAGAFLIFVFVRVFGWEMLTVSA